MAKTTETTVAPATQPGTGGDTQPASTDSHIRFVGHSEDGENSVCTVFGKNFRRGVWVPFSNLDGTNPDKKALTEGQIAKLRANPAFETGDGNAQFSLPGVEETPAEEA